MQDLAFALMPTIPFLAQLCAIRLYSFSISPVAYRNYSTTHQSPSVNWPPSDTHAFNQHRIGPSVARSVLRTLRRGSARMERMSRFGGDAGLFESDGEGDRPNYAGQGSLLTPGTPVNFDLENVDLEAEISTFVTSMIELFKANGQIFREDGIGECCD